MTFDTLQTIGDHPQIEACKLLVAQKIVLIWFAGGGFCFSLFLLNVLTGRNLERIWGEGGITLNSEEKKNY